LAPRNATTRATPRAGARGNTVARAARNGLNGTYQLDAARSDDPQRIANLAISRLGVNDRTGARQRIVNRLDPPDYLAIERTGSRVTIASSKAPQMTFDADGRARVENAGTGRNLTTRATIVGNSDRGDVNGRAGDSVSPAIFEPLGNGDLRVTRRLNDDSLRQPLEVRSIYRRTSPVADWNLYDTRNEYGNQYAQPDLRPELSESTSPRRAERHGARGHARPVGGRLVGATERSRDADGAQLGTTGAGRRHHRGAHRHRRRAACRTARAFRSSSIRSGLRDGRTADFDGTVESVRGPNGEGDLVRRRIAERGQLAGPWTRRSSAARLARRWVR
jgi:hypothetical protein